jgi:hypothetical protein
MNMIVENHFDVLDQTMALTTQLLDTLSDDDLTFTLPGGNPALGEQIQELGELYHIYTESYKTLKHNYGYKHDAAVSKSVDALKAWFKELAPAFKETIAALSDDDLNTKMIDRGGFSFPAGVQFHVFREGLLIYYGKISVYLKAMGKPMTDQWKAWIG